MAIAGCTATLLLLLTPALLGQTQRQATAAAQPSAWMPTDGLER